MTLKTILQPVKPQQLIGVFVSYLLGAGLVQYVDRIENVDLVVQGGLFLLTFVLALDYLCDLQGTFHEDFLRNTSSLDLNRIRWVYGIIAAALLTFDTSLMASWMMQGHLWSGLTVLLITLFAVGALYYLAEVRDNLQVYQVLFEVIIVIVAPPVLAFMLQSSSIHRFLMMSVVILIPLYLAYRLLEGLIQYDLDRELAPNRLGILVGWDTVMVIHNAMILMAYVLLALMTLLGLPWFITWPVFLGLPIGLLEIWLMERVRKGSKPLWKIMRVATASMFLFSGYFLSFAFWLR